MTTTAPDFLGHRLPSMAVACPDCHVRAGVECRRPSGHKAMMLHAARHAEADRLWLALDLPTITHHPDGSFTYDGPETRPSKAKPGEATMKKRKTTKTTNRRDRRAAAANLRKAKASKRRRPPAPRGKRSTRKAAARKARPLASAKRTKADELADFLTFAGGRSIEAVCAEFGWLPHSARAAISRLGTDKDLNVDTTKADTGGTIYEIKAAADDDRAPAPAGARPFNPGGARP